MATMVRAALVVANWFQAKRGIAMGLAIAGVAASGMIMAQVATGLFRSAAGAAYAASALLLLLIVFPLVLLVVRTHTP